MKGEAGKGSKPRPLSIPYLEYIKNWEMAFGKDFCAKKKKRKKDDTKKRN
jgi:hypothetical protein